MFIKNMLGFRGLLQYNQEDCGAACLASILKYYGKKYFNFTIKK
ncbi:cysteine peptidase family C39 domain-containing protein [Streptococcus uberis]